MKFINSSSMEGVFNSILRVSFCGVCFEKGIETKFSIRVKK